MELINPKHLNELLQKDTRHKYFLSEAKGHTGVPDGRDGEQGEYNETFKFYRHPEMPPNIFLQVVFVTDSYGDNQTISEMKLVEGKEKKITIYEPI